MQAYCFRFFLLVTVIIFFRDGMLFRFMASLTHLSVHIIDTALILQTLGALVLA